jgi:hypothetical protein
MSDATIVYVTARSLTMSVPDTVVYHVAASRDYRMRTWCGLVIWSNEQQDNGRLVPLRRDTASCFASCCQTCSPWEPDL